MLGVEVRRWVREVVRVLGGRWEPGVSTGEAAAEAAAAAGCSRAAGVLAPLPLLLLLLLLLPRNC